LSFLAAGLSPPFSSAATMGVDRPSASTQPAVIRRYMVVSCGIASPRGRFPASYRMTGALPAGFLPTEPAGTGAAGGPEGASFLLPALIAVGPHGSFVVVGGGMDEIDVQDGIVESVQLPNILGDRLARGNEGVGVGVVNLNLVRLAERDDHHA